MLLTIRVKCSKVIEKDNRKQNKKLLDKIRLNIIFAKHLKLMKKSIDRHNELLLQHTLGLPSSDKTNLKNQHFIINMS